MSHQTAPSDRLAQQDGFIPPANIDAIPREVAAAINPLISVLDSHNTMEDVADLIEGLGIAACANASDEDVITKWRLHHQLTTVMASALRYEVAQQLKFRGLS